MDDLQYRPLAEWSDIRDRLYLESRVGSVPPGRPPATVIGQSTPTPPIPRSGSVVPGDTVGRTPILGVPGAVTPNSAEVIPREIEFPNAQPEVPLNDNSPDPGGMVIGDSSPEFDEDDPTTTTGQPLDGYFANPTELDEQGGMIFDPNTDSRFRLPWDPKPETIGEPYLPDDGDTYEGAADTPPNEITRQRRQPRRV